MCGILCAISKEKIDSKMDDILKSFSYRGPDLSRSIRGTMNNFNTYAGFNRLSIRDCRVNAMQPYGDDEIYILFNGEIYNTMELVKEYRLTMLETKSDTEIIYKIYKLLGTEVFEKLAGMFAIVVYDKLLNKIYCARDGSGIKPLFYSCSDSKFVVSSNIAGVHELDKNNSLDDNFFYNKMLLGLYAGSSNTTPFKNIHSILPGEILEISISNSILSLNKFKYTFNDNKVLDWNRPEEIRNYLKEVFTQYLISDVNIGVSLSGGIDSSLIVALLADEEKLNIFSIADEKSNDSIYAQKVVDAFSKNIIGVNYIDPNYTLSIKKIDEIVYSLGMPIMDERIFLLEKIYETAKQKGMTVYLNGQGADEHWYGYYAMRWNWITELYDTDMSIEKLTNYIFSFLENTNQKDFWKLDNDLTEYISDIYSRFDISIEDPNERLSTFIVDYALPMMLHNEDTASMLNSLEVRVPFLDQRIISLANKLPSEKHVENFGKYYLKEICKDIFGTDFAMRKKEPLPKKIKVSDSVKRIYWEHYDEISKSEIIKKYINLEVINKNIDKDVENFYGNVNDLIIFTISLWRFEYVFGL